MSHQLDAQSPSSPSTPLYGQGDVRAEGAQIRKRLVVAHSGGGRGASCRFF